MVTLDELYEFLKQETELSIPIIIDSNRKLYY